MMYRVGLRFIADAPRMAGRVRGAGGFATVARVIRTGAWRVVECWPTTRPDGNGIYIANSNGTRVLMMTSARKLVPHRLVNPRKVLAEYLAARRAPGVEVIQSTREEKAAAFEWLRGFALGRSKDARHAGIMLSEVARLNEIRRRQLDNLRQFEAGNAMTETEAALARMTAPGGDEPALREGAPQ